MPPTYEEKDSLHGSAGSPPFSNWGSSNLPEAFYPLNALLRWRRRHFPSTGVRRLEAPLRRRAPSVESSAFAAAATDRGLEAPAGGGLAG